MNTTGRRHASVRITVLLIVAIGSLVFLSAGLVLALSGPLALRNTVDLLHASAETTLSVIEREIESHLSPVEGIVERAVELVADGTIDPARPETFYATLSGALLAAPQVSGIAYWDPDGIAHTLLRNEDGSIAPPRSEPTTNEAILKLLAADLSHVGTRWRRPVRQDGVTYINASAPLFRDGQQLGIIAAGVAVSALSAYVEGSGGAFGMTGFILYGTDRVLAHPRLEQGMQLDDGESVPLLSLDAFDDGVLRQYPDSPVIERERRQGLLVREVAWQGRDYLILSRPNWSFGQTAWHIGVYAPKDQLVEQLMQMIAAVGAGLVVVVLALIAAVVLARYIGRPIRRFAAAADRIGRLELSDIATLPSSRITELDEQANAFNRMLEALKWFETYVPKRIVTRLIEGGHKHMLVSRESDLTVMFTDIIGFTALAERMSPAEVGAMLNAHFETVARCIEAEGGTLDKYIGDSVMAFWGAPEEQPDHAERACRAAVAIARAVAGSGDGAAGRAPLRIKIALHSGPLLVGNIGARSRMNYTVIGDTVNTCSRIERLCGSHDDGAPAVVLVSDDTRHRVPDGALEFADAGSFEVKGRREPVRVSRLVVSA